MYYTLRLLWIIKHISAIKGNIFKSNDSLTIHGFAAEDNPDTPGLLHGVINQENFGKCFEYQILQDGQQCTELCAHYRKLPFKDVYIDTIYL